MIDENAAAGGGDDADGAAPQRFAIRWFTPACEVALCGHATLGAAHALWATGSRASKSYSGRSHVRKQTGQVGHHQLESSWVVALRNRTWRHGS
jgi:predicted PhzF superfamily epimerase YddE/YHI9